MECETGVRMLYVLVLMILTKILTHTVIAAMIYIYYSVSRNANISIRYTIHIKCDMLKTLCFDIRRSNQIRV